MQPSNTQPNDAGETINTGESPAVKGQRRFSMRRQLRAICGMYPRQVGLLLLRAYRDWSDDGATRLGAALAYYTLFSIAPVLIVITGIGGFFVAQAATRAELSPWLQRFLSPEGARAAELMLAQHATPAGGVVTTQVGFVALFVATSTFVNELRQSMNLVWRVPAPPADAAGVLSAIRTTVTDRVYGFLITIGAAVLILVLFLINTAIAIAGAHFHASLPVPAPLLHALHFGVSFLLMTALFTLVYKTLPDAYVSWGDAGVGAVATAFLFDVGTLPLSTFIAQSGNSPYSTAASVLALLAWVYYSAQVFFFGAELTRIFATTYGGGIVPVHRSLGPQLWRRSRAQPRVDTTTTP